MINGQKEIWKMIPHIKIVDKNKQVIAVSNCGRLMRGNGRIDIIKLRQGIMFNGKFTRIYRILMIYFKPKTEDDIIKQRYAVDHITHNPTNMYVNDIRNLRWCTIKENANFDEAKENYRNMCILRNKPDKEIVEKRAAKLRGRAKNEFGRLFKEKYNLTVIMNCDINLYQKEYTYWRRHGKLKD